MAIWLIFAGLTGAALIGVLWPVVRGISATAPRREFDRLVFMDQLAELDRDQARGVIGASEAEAARNEISRRLISAGQIPQPAMSSAGRPAAALLAAIAIPLVAVPLYLRSGQPAKPDVPLSDRIANAAQNNDFPAMVAQVEAHLKDNPSDAQAWIVLAPAYKRLSRFADAARAYAKIIELGAAEPESFADLGEMIFYQSEGLVTAEAAAAFREASARDARNPKARYYLALALKQEGKAEEAVAAWKSLLDDSPADAPWRSTVDREIAAVAAADMTPDDRNAMIRGMVDGLEERLKTDAGDLEGWQKLINARKVLGEIDKARAAYQQAKTIFKERPDAIASLDELARSLSIQ